MIVCQWPNPEPDRCLPGFNSGGCLHFPCSGELFTSVDVVRMHFESSLHPPHGIPNGTGHISQRKLVSRKFRRKWKKSNRTGSRNKKSPRNGTFCVDLRGIEPLSKMTSQRLLHAYSAFVSEPGASGRTVPIRAGINLGTAF